MQATSNSSNLCVLCRAVSEVPAQGRPIFDTHLFRSPDFVVIPSVGPVVPGHVMVVSRDHCSNLASLSTAAKRQYNRLLDQISKLPPYRRKNLLEAEHGSSSSESGGACINHLHVNLIPGLTGLATLFDGKLPQLPIQQLMQLTATAAPYIFMRDGTTLRVYEAIGVPSQLIRRAVFEHLDRSDWDWGVFPNLEIVQETIELWKGIANV